MSRATCCQATWLQSPSPHRRESERERNRDGERYIELATCCQANKTTKWFYYNGFITQAKSKQTIRQRYKTSSQSRSVRKRDRRETRTGMEQKRERCTFELRRECGSPLSAMLLSSFNAFVAYLPYATWQLHYLFSQCTKKKCAQPQLRSTWNKRNKETSLQPISAQ